MSIQSRLTVVVCIVAATRLSLPAVGQDLAYPPKLPGGKQVVTDRSEDFLKPLGDLQDGVEIAKTPPRIDFMYYPEQTYPGNPWSVWGDGLAAKGKYYSAVGDHTAPAGNAFLYEYDPETKKLRTLVNVKETLKLPEGHYAPGKIHSRIDLGDDGWLYFSTHRGSTRVTTDQYHYQGDWILRRHPEKGTTEIVARGPVSKHCIPTSVLDPKRLIFYGGTAAGIPTDKTIMFFAYDVKNRKVLHASKGGPYRYLIFSKSTGRVYYCNKDEGPLMRYDPESGGPPVQIDAVLGLRSATQETPDGYVYTVSTRPGAALWRFNVKTEQAEKIGHAAVASRVYVTSLDADPTGRFLYYVPGAHGGAERDGTPVVQFNVQTGKKKIIAFLHPFQEKKYGYVALGTFGSAVSEDGSKLYVTWNGSRGKPTRGRYRFDTCALTVIHIPESER
ncbi:MAG: hypothetical protein N2C14_20655 [Planctomycetales bacterium]